MQSNLKKLIKKLNKLKTSFSIPVKSLNDLNQIAIALKRTGYKGTFSSYSGESLNHIAEAKHYCYSARDDKLIYPIGISAFNIQGNGKEYIIVNWDVRENSYGNLIVRL